MDIIIYIFLFMSGACFASFIHVYVTRTIKGESIVYPRSHCTNCNHVLKWYELIPIFSYIFLGGRCSKCNKEIGDDSLCSEVVLGCLFTLIYSKFGLSYESLIGFVLSMMLLAIIISDFKEMIILDSTIIFAGIFVYAIVFAELGLRGIYKSFLYGVFAFVLFFLIKILGDKAFGREALGGGDVKLAFIMGSVLPYDMFLISVVIGSALALPYALYINIKKSNREVAFGPFLALGLLVVFIFKAEISSLIGIV